MSEEQTFEVPASQADEDQGDEVLVQNPTWTSQILSIPAEKLEEFEAAGWAQVEDSDENSNKAVKSGRTYRHHFGDSSTP